MTLKQIEKNVTFLDDVKGNKASVVLPLEIFEALIEELEDCYDVATAITRSNEKSVVYTLEEVMAMLNKKSDA